MKETDKTDTAMSFVFNQMYKVSTFKFRKSVFSVDRKEFDHSSEYNSLDCIFHLNLGMLLVRYFFYYWASYLRNFSLF